MLARLALSLALTIAPFATPAHAQPGKAVLKFMASDGNWTDRSFTGHAFVCVQLTTGKDVKDDCFGFYPRTTGKTLVGGPGIIDREFDFSKKPPARFTNVQASITKPITASQRRQVLSFIRGFDKDFSLTPTNCLSFANGVARLVGLKTPASTSSATPVQFLNELRRLNPGI